MLRRISYSVVSYLFVSFSVLIISVGKRELNFLPSFTCNYIVSVRRSILFLLLRRIGCVILFWHSLDIPYNYFLKYTMPKF